MNLTIFQCFHWYNIPEERLWTFIREKAGYFSELGISHAWLPPAYKSAFGTLELCSNCRSGRPESIPISSGIIVASTD